MQCWTSKDTKLQTTVASSFPTHQLQLCYRTRDGRLRETFVPIRNLRVCTPKVKDHVLIFGKDGTGTVKQVVRFQRDNIRNRVITAVEVQALDGKQAKSDIHDIDTVTRLTLSTSACV